MNIILTMDATQLASCYNESLCKSAWQRMPCRMERKCWTAGAGMSLIAPMSALQVSSSLLFPGLQVAADHCSWDPDPMAVVIALYMSVLLYIHDHDHA